MRSRIGVSVALAVAAGWTVGAAAQTPPGKPPVAAVRPVTETFFGTTLVDPYRYMETPADPETVAWMKAQGAYTRSVLDAVPGRAAHLERLSALGAQFGLATDYAEAGGRSFYLERPAGADVFDLVVREKDGRARKLVDVAALIARTGKPHAINYFAPSQDGAKVAVGVSVGGNENADLTVLDVASGRQIAGPISDARFASPAFTADGKRLVFTRSQALKPGQPRTDTFLNRVANVWDMTGQPVVTAGAPAGVGPKIRPDEAPTVVLTPGSKTAVMIVSEGVRNEVDLYVAPAAAAAGGPTAWRKIADRAEGVTGAALQGETLYLLTNQNAPTFRVTRMSTTGTAATATEVLAAKPGRVLEFIGAASDGLYVAALEGVYGKLLRLPAGGGAVQEIPLPVKGTIGQMFTDPRQPGAVLMLAGWNKPLAQHRYDPATGRFTELPLGAKPASFNPDKYAVSDLQAVAKDGVKVPLSVVTAAGPKTARPLLLTAYGSYGISQVPGFNAGRIALIDAGGTAATCHVRGGGELGEAWRLGGKDANKPNTWRDLIACAEHLIAQGYTTREQLVIQGGSAGGITVGRAMIERPDLFAGVVSQVPMASAVRAEFQQNGPVNIVEFGTVKDPRGFKNLLAMDAYYTVKDGTTYPAVMFTTGLNDTRVDSWQPAKAAARMQAAGSPNPVLLRVQQDAGHGGGQTKRQTDELNADIAAFLFWRAGAPGWTAAAR